MLLTPRARSDEEVEDAVDGQEEVQDDEDAAASHDSEDGDASVPHAESLLTTQVCAAAHHHQVNAKQSGRATVIACPYIPPTCTCAYLHEARHDCLETYG